MCLMLTHSTSRRSMMEAVTSMSRWRTRTSIKFQLQTSSSPTLHQPSRSLRPHGTSATMKLERAMDYTKRISISLAHWLAGQRSWTFHPSSCQTKALALQVPCTRITTNSPFQLLTPTETTTRPSQASSGTFSKNSPHRLTWTMRCSQPISSN